jgi:hypothetical protein
MDRRARWAGMVLGTAVALESEPVWCACDPQHLNQCTIDLFQGPVLAPSRATGLGGAFAAYAEGVDAIASNAAAVAVRMPYSLNWFDFDVTVGVSFPAAFRGTDFDNDGQVGFTYNDFLFYTLGGQLQFGPWGLGVLADFQRYDVSPPNSTGGTVQGNETLGRLHALVGRSFWSGLVSVGLGVRLVTLSIDTTQNSQRQSQLTMNGIGPEVGLLIRPDYEPWRLGATFRAQVNNHIGGSGGPSVNLAEPANIALPFELELGAAIQVGPRPLNPRWLDPHEQEERLRRQIEDDRQLRQAAQEAELERVPDDAQRAARKEQLDYQERFVRREEDERLERASDALALERQARYANWPRERITVLLELLVSGPAPRDAIGLESFFAAQLGSNGTTMPVLLPSGQNVSYSPRLGLEGEPVPDFLQTRFGTYIEPSRFARRLARQHFTFGLDMKLFSFGLFGLFSQIWRIGGFADLAPRYQNFGVSIGAWH